MLACSDEQARLIEALLTLASSESGLNGHEPVDLATTVAATLAGLQPDVERLGIHIDEMTEPAPLDGDSLLINGSPPTCSPTPSTTTLPPALSRS